MIHGTISTSAIAVLRRGSLPLVPRSTPIDNMTQIKVAPWRTLHGVPETSTLYETLFDGVDDAGGMPHSIGLRDHLQALCGATQPILLYLHRGHSKDTHSPILQHLLRLLDHRSHVHALRVETRKARRDAMVLARSLTRKNQPVLVLSDPTERLAAHPVAIARIRYVLLSAAEPATMHAPSSFQPLQQAS